MRRFSIAAALSLMVGCGADGSGGMTVEIVARGAAMVVVQDGEDAFRPLPLGAGDAATFHVTSDHYGVGMFCLREFPGGVLRPLSTWVFDTEARTVSLGCSFLDTTSVRFTGKTTPGAEVFAEPTGLAPGIADENGAYEIDVRSGAPVDVVALVHAEPPRMVIVRDVDTSADQVVGLALSEGADLIPVTPVVTNAPLETVSLGSDLNTTSTYVFFGSSLASAANPSIHIPPASLLRETDHPAIMASTADCTIQTPSTTTAPTLRVPTSPLVGVDGSEVSWSLDPNHQWEETTLLLASPAREYQSTIRASSSWRAIRRTGDTFRLFDVTTEIAGWIEAFGGFRAGQSISLLFFTYEGRYDSAYATCNATTTFTW